jgi:hypothetical protein
MAKDTITVALNGDAITLDIFAQAISKFQLLISGLTNEVAPNITVKWVLVGLETSSAIATAQGCVEDDEQVPAVERIVDAYLDVGHCLQEGTPFRYSPVLWNTAQDFVSILNGTVRSIRFENPDDDVEILRRVPSATAKTEELSRPRKTQVVWGAMRGRVQCLSNRGGLRFTLYDLVDDKAVSCYLPQGYEGIMRDAWGKTAVVEGRIHRDPETGRATTIRDVKNVKVLSEGKPGEWREALRAAPGFLGAALPEEVIRRSRDD